MTARQPSILVTGGAGYIGSHVVLALVERGERVVVLDDLSTGFADAVIGASLHVGDIGDIEAVTALLRDHAIDTVMHFAARTIVPESVADPLRYYDANVSRTRNLLVACRDAGVQHVVLSSTAAVYGNIPSGIADETMPTEPINPYGASKLACEWMLRDLCRSSTLRHVTLRYFNVAGSDPAARIGLSARHSGLLFKMACEVATGRHDALSIFGTDFDTADGTGVRDFIHVADLANAHVDALRHLRGGGESVTLNCGYGHGYSVREVIAAVERAAGARLRVIEAARRVGDPPFMISDSSRIRQAFGWQPRYDDLDLIARHALAWERRLADQQRPSR